MLLLSFIITFLISVILTPFIIKFSFKVGATDKPDQRKVHLKIMPRLGGIGIYLSFIAGVLIFIDEINTVLPLLIGSTIIFITGVLDDFLTLKPVAKLGGQLTAAVVTVLMGIQMDYITLPVLGKVEFGFWAIPITLIWIVAITNAINLIDGLDGLAVGVSSIALTTIAFLSISKGNELTAILSVIMLGSSIGFLLFNFNPAKIFMGDSGSLLLGYMLSVLSVLGLFKNVTLLSLISPIIILAVPIIDTFFAIIRRWINKKPISAPDKMHLHHRLIELGFSHRQTVVFIYCLSALFSVLAIIYNRATMWGSISIIVLLFGLIELLVEITGLVHEEYRPFLNALGYKKN